MPAFATHYFFAKDIFDNIEEEIKERIKTYRSYYDLGAQGPDIFLFYKPHTKNNVSDYGKEIHKKYVKNIIVEACKKIHEYNDEGALMYLLGFVSHFVLDNALHPTINKVSKDFNDHMIIEKELDRNIIIRYSKHRPEIFRRHYLINKTKKYASQLSLIYPTISKRFLEECVYQTELNMRNIYAPGKLKLKIIKAISNKYANGLDYTHMAITKEVNHDFDDTINTLIEKYDNSIELAIQLYKNVLDYYDGKCKLDERFYQNFN